MGAGGGSVKAAFLVDFAVVKRRTAKYLAILAVITVVCMAVMGPLPWITLYTGLLVPLMAMQILLMNDERNGWQGFRLAMPFTRRDAVLGRYAVLAAMSAAGVAVGVAGCLVAEACVLWAPALTAAMRYPYLFDGSIMALSIAASLFIPLVMAGVSLPLAMRLGYTRTVQFVPVLFMMVFPLAPVLLRPGSGFDASAFMAFATTPEGAVVVTAGLLVVACALYAASAWLTYRLCRKRGF
ncbi:ABC-2 transporter permease [Arabiibacter massiliensis]|uniref:ABC-2 transporter permease n=1 Tax=Arabiibacter massiliensis TaxID=1870985 RepID=UPI0009B96689|nr:ABC-2 transporter permease [Arabiibacter massiliensis]